MFNRTIKYFCALFSVSLLLSFFIPVTASACSSDDDCGTCQVCKDSKCVSAPDGTVCQAKGTDCSGLTTTCRSYGDVDKVCKNGKCVDGTCNNWTNTPQGTVCQAGGTDCDYLDTTCRDYHDVDKVCDGNGNCVNGTCNDWTNTPQGTVCQRGGTDCDYLDTTCKDYHDVDKVCDGNGNCIDGTCNDWTNTKDSCGTDTNTCTEGENCHCQDYKQYCDTDTDKTCTKYCSDGECGTCNLPECDVSHQGTDNDSDGYDAECGDCNDNNASVYPGNDNPYCDCNGSTPADHPSANGISELTGCHLDASGRHFEKGCLCLDGIDNNCDGLVDFEDSDCPDLGHDMVIDTEVTVNKSKDISPNGLFVTSTGKLILDPGVVLTVGKKKGVVINSGGEIVLKGDEANKAHIKIKD